MDLGSHKYCNQNWDSRQKWKSQISVFCSCFIKRAPRYLKLWVSIGMVHITMHSKMWTLIDIIIGADFGFLPSCQEWKVYDIGMGTDANLNQWPSLGSWNLPPCAIPQRTSKGVQLEFSFWPFQVMSGVTPMQLQHPEVMWTCPWYSCVTSW